MLSFHDEAAGAVDRASGDVIASGFFDRHRLAGEHRLIKRAAACYDLAVDRHFLSRPHPHRIADVEMCHGDIFFRLAFAEPQN